MNNSAFVALLAPSGNMLPDRLTAFAERLRRRHGLVTLVDSPPLLVLGAAQAAHLILPGSRGIVWGHLFDRSSGARLESVDWRGEEPAERFVERFWGGYVALRATDGGADLLRDASGAVACYHGEIDGTHIVTSRPDLLFLEGLLEPSIDWTIVAQGLVYRDIRPARTALRGVSEMLPGVAAHIEAGRFVTRCAWSPWRFAGAEEAPDLSGAAAHLRDTLIATLRAWGGCFDRPLVEISGGLDSAIVAAGLQMAGSRATCLTFGPSSGDPDERPWARAVANHLGFDLSELVLSPEGVDLTRSDAAHLPRPCARAFSQALDRPIQALARRIGADAFLGGAGGDNVFCLLQSALPVIDRLECEGLGAGVLRTASDIARLSRSHIWQVLLVALRRRMRRRGAFPKPRTNRFVAEEVARTLPWPAENPWLEAPPHIPPGKRRHVWSLIGIQNHLEGYGREMVAPYVSPLMSQPVLEACLAIPSWLWCAGGNNRAVARQAFRDLLPASVIDRRTKGAFDGFALQLIERNRPLLRTMLLDGALADQGMLDRGAVAACLDGGPPRSEVLPELMALADIEAWVGGWQRR